MIILKKILIIDDEPDILEFLAYHLKQEGFETVVVKDSKEGFNKSKQEKPDLILLDIMMPAPDGFEILEKLKKTPVTKEIPVMIISAKYSELDIMNAYSLGARDYLNKPFSPRMLITRINAILGLTIKGKKDTEMVVNPIFSNRKFQQHFNFCFVLMPFNQPWSSRVWSIIKKIIEEQKFECKRADDLFGFDILEDIWSSIMEANIVIADITNNNANVMYEVGVAHTLGKNVILLTQDVNDIPFDFKRFRHIAYEDNTDGFARIEKLLPYFLEERKQTSIEDKQNISN